MHRTFIRLIATLMVWAARVAPATAFGSLLFVLDGGLRWLGLLALPLLLLALRGDSLGCGPRGCNLGGDRGPRHWPNP